MVTDAERRTAAQNLKHFAYDQLQGGLLNTLKVATGVDGTWRDVLLRLADLIEPHRGSGGRTILCAHCESVSWCGCEPGDEQGGCDFEPRVTEGEPPYNLYSLYEVVFRRHPRDEYAIDDNEVEELVDALLYICNAPGHDIIQRLQPSCDRDALLALADEMDSASEDGLLVRDSDLMAWARRVREALGAV